VSVARTEEIVLVAGATGFIGRRLVNVLRDQNAHIRALVRDVSRIAALWPDNSVVGISHDLSQPGGLGDVCEGVDTVFHLSSSGEAPDDTRHLYKPRGSGRETLVTENLHYKTTVEGTQRLLDAAVRGHVKRFIYFSSAKVFGEGNASCLDENSETRPDSSYGSTKFEGEQLVLEAGKRYGLHVCVLRLPLVYGLDNNGNLQRMIDAIDRGRFPSLPEVGNKRSMVHVADVVQAALLVAEKPAANGQIYLVTDGQIYSTRQLYVMICHALNRPVPTWHVPPGVLRALGRTGDFIGRMRGRPFMFDSTVLQRLLGSAWYSSEKISRELGYQPTRTLDNGIKEMVEEYRRTKS
jgi:nucleoside-diphosphate-sugar epimerase